MKLPAISICLLILFASCGNIRKDSNYNEARELVPNPEGYAKDHAVEVPKTTIGYILFGRFCGECGGHNCATMFQYTPADNSLWVDSTDGFWELMRHHEIKLACNTKINNKKRIDLAGSVVQHIPQSFLDSKDTIKRYGCPDCTDGCGIYFEWVQNGQRKQYSIDPHDSKLPPEIQAFCNYLESIIFELKGSPEY